MQLRQIAGYGLLLVSLAAFFWWGYQFDTWGKRFSFDPAFLGFLSWFAIGAFGAGYGAGGIRVGLRYAAGVVAILAVALFIGFARGSYS